MQTKKDRVHAYQTLVGRMSAALLLGDTNYSETPARRALVGLVLGLVLALLVGVGFWVYGLINPGGNTVWRKPGVVLVEKESGARFVYQQGVLVPIRNHASALLLQGTGAKIETISRASLAGLERGQTVGIDGAPDPLPAPRSLVTTPWLLCLPRTGGVEVQGTGLMSMNANPDAVNGATTTPLGENEHMWVGSPDGKQYVLLRSVKLRLAEPLVAVVLGFGAGTPPTAPQAWLDAMPNGPDIAPAVVPEQGRTVRMEDGSQQVGTVFRQAAVTGAENFAVLRADGLAPVSRTEAALMLARSGRSAVEITAASMAAAPRSGDDSLTRRIPDLLATTPAPTGERAFCLRQVPSGATVVSEAVTTGRTSAWFGMNDRVGPYLKPGSGMLVASVPAPTGAGTKPDRFLITDQGIKYRLADDDAISALGFGGITPQPLPAAVLAQIPSGPLLSRAAVGVLEKGRG